ncbi:MAG: disulfide bond formation protein B [Pseudomonadota bacterium]
MLAKIKPYLINEKLMTLGMALIAAAALGMALIAQYVFDLAPCNLCVIQRYPYGFVIAFGLLGFFMAEKSPKATAIRMFFIGTSFLINSAIAFYHTGVERLWWKSALEGCNVPEIDPNNILASIEAAPIVRCDEIPWADPILGLSMANYNVIFCLGLAVISYISMRLLWKKD